MPNNSETIPVRISHHSLSMTLRGDDLQHTGDQCPDGDDVQQHQGGQLRVRKRDDPGADADDAFDQECPAVIVLHAEGRDERQNAIDQGESAPQQDKHGQRQERPDESQHPKNHRRDIAS